MVLTALGLGAYPDTVALAKHLAGSPSAFQILLAEQEVVKVIPFATSIHLPLLMSMPHSAPGLAP